MKQVKIKRISTDEENVSQRHVSYDLYIDGEYTQTYNDINDALEAKEQEELKK